MIKISQRVLSPTAINTYLQCPRKFYLRYIKKLRTRPSIHLIRGQIVHQTLHKFHKTHPQVSSANPIGVIRKELFATFNQLWQAAENRLDSLGMTPEQIEFYHDDSELMLLNYSHWFYKHDMLPPDLTEARIFSKTFRLMGIIDAVYEEKDRTILVDYKSSKNPKITDDIKRQAAIYALLYFDRFQETPEAIWIHFLKEVGDPAPIHVDEHLLDYARILVASVREKTSSFDESSYPCKCGGYCRRDFVENGSHR